jgi:hypothetical protein
MISSPERAPADEFASEMDAKKFKPDPAMRARLAVWMNEGGAPSARPNDGGDDESVSECPVVEHAF